LFPKLSVNLHKTAAYTDKAADIKCYQIRMIACTVDILQILNVKMAFAESGAANYNKAHH
jgi:hypothetical protein